MKNVSKECWDKMMKTHNNDAEWVEELIEEYGAEVCERGWDYVWFEDTDMVEVCRIDDIWTVEDDEEAVAKAMEAGVKFIPVEELPENFDRRYLGWIDTPENRKAIEEYSREV